MQSGTKQFVTFNEETAADVTPFYVEHFCFVFFYTDASPLLLLLRDNEVKLKRPVILQTAFFTSNDCQLRSTVEAHCIQFVSYHIHTTSTRA